MMIGIDVIMCALSFVMMFVRVDGGGLGGSIRVVIGGVNCGLSIVLIVMGSVYRVYTRKGVEWKGNRGRAWSCVQMMMLPIVSPIFLQILLEEGKKEEGGSSKEEVEDCEKRVIESGVKDYETEVVQALPQNCDQARHDIEGENNLCKEAFPKANKDFSAKHKNLTSVLSTLQKTTSIPNPTFTTLKGHSLLESTATHLPSDLQKQATLLTPSKPSPFTNNSRFFYRKITQEEITKFEGVEFGQRECRARSADKAKECWFEAGTDFGSGGEENCKERAGVDYFIDSRGNTITKYTFRNGPLAHILSSHPHHNPSTPRASIPRTLHYSTLSLLHSKSKPRSSSTAQQPQASTLVT